MVQCEANGRARRNVKSRLVRVMRAHWSGFFRGMKGVIMAGMIIEFEFKDHALVVLEGSTAKFWLGEGLPTWEGPLDGFANEYPDRIAVLLKEGIVSERK